MSEIIKIDLSNKKTISESLDQINVSIEKTLLTILRDRETQRKKQENKESKETRKIEKTPFIIDENLSLEEKIAKGWKLCKDQKSYINGKSVVITILENPSGDIWEFVDGIPPEYVGKQLFTPVAAERETQRVGKNIVKNPKEFSTIMEDWQSKNQEKIKEEKKEMLETGGFYNPIKFFLKNNYPLLGYRKPDGTYGGMGIYTNIRFEGGKCLLLANEDVRSKMKESDLHTCGFQVLCYAE